MPRQTAYCDIELSLTGFRLHVAELTASNPASRSTDEFAFADLEVQEGIQVFAADVLTEIDLVFTRAILPEQVLVRGAVGDAVPERLRELTAIQQASARFHLPLSEFRVTFLRERFALQYVLCEIASLLDVETYLLFRKLGLVAICARHPVLARTAVVLHACRGESVSSPTLPLIERAPVIPA